ncbi:MAG: helix-turn-helix domain-containing protein [Alphaproteobacteria bacterium]|nr:helix-turn-helix domain-containing protein [Alphaproteobacteria bacterium]
MSLDPDTSRRPRRASRALRSKAPPARIGRVAPARAEVQRPPRTAEAGHDRDIVHSALKAFDILRVFGRTKPRMTLSEVAEQAGVSRATARRFLLTFVHAGYMQSDGKWFEPTPRLLELSHSVVSATGLWEAGRPIMAELAETLGESIYGAVLDGTEVLYVAHLPSPHRVVNIALRVGSRLPVHATSTGRVLLSGLSDKAAEQLLIAARPAQLTPKTITSRTQLRQLVAETRRRGFAIADEELELGLRSISVPIRSLSGEVIAALNACGPSARVSLTDLQRRFLPALLDAAERMGRNLAD